MKVYAVAMTEIQDDSVLCDAGIEGSWEAAVKTAEDFMARCVGDFFEMDPGDWDARRAAVEKRVFRDVEEFKWGRRMKASYECEGLVVAVCVSEEEVKA